MKSHNIHFFSLTSIINHRTSSSSSLIKTGTQVYFQIQYTVTQYSEFEQYFDYAKLYRSNLKKLYNMKDFFTKLYSCKNTLITMYEVASKLFKKTHYFAYHHAEIVTFNFNNGNKQCWSICIISLFIVNGFDTTSITQCKGNTNTKSIVFKTFIIAQRPILAIYYAFQIRILLIYCHCRATKLIV